MKRLLLPLALLLCASAVHAHPVPKNSHDRTVVVRLQPGDRPGETKVRVDYRLEVDEWTVLEKDLEPFRDELDPTDYRGNPLKFYGEFARRYAPALADRLVARANGKRLDFRCVAVTPRLQDEAGQSLGHLRCEFVFETSFSAKPTANELIFREHCYLGEEGQVNLSLAHDAGLSVTAKVEPDEALKKRPALERQPGDDEKLREVRATFALPATWAVSKAPYPASAKPAAAPKLAGNDERPGLLQMFFNTDHGLWLLMGLAAIVTIIITLSTPSSRRTR